MICHISLVPKGRQRPFSVFSDKVRHAKTTSRSAHVGTGMQAFRPSFSTHRRRLYSKHDARKGLRPLRRDAAHIGVTMHWLCPFLSLSSLICIFRDRHTACHWTKDLDCFEALKRDLEGSLGCSLTLNDSKELFSLSLNAEEPLPALLLGT